MNIHKVKRQRNSDTQNRRQRTATDLPPLNGTVPSYAPDFEKVGDILVSACPCVCMGHRDIVLKLHVWIPHGKITDAYFWFSLNYLPLLNYGPLTNKGMKFCRCRISNSIIARNLKLLSADRG